MNVYVVIQAGAVPRVFASRSAMQRFVGEHAAIDSTVCQVHEVALEKREYKRTEVRA